MEPIVVPAMAAGLDRAQETARDTFDRAQGAAPLASSDTPERGNRPRYRSRSAFVITDAEEKLIASAAIIGESSQPVTG